MPGAPTTDDTEFGRRMTEFATKVRQDHNEILCIGIGHSAQVIKTLLMERVARMSRLSFGDDPWRLVILLAQWLFQLGVHYCIRSAGNDYRVAGSG
ncbi:hypothetical protein Tco_0213534 [Tanacetum coccineum]